MGRTGSRWLNSGVWCVVAFLVALPLAGCGSARPTSPTSQAKAEQEILAAAAHDTPTQQTTTSAEASSITPDASAPVIHWTEDEWPFTAQLISITKQPEGLAEVGGAQPGNDWMIVRIDIMSQTPGRSAHTPGAPEDSMTCSGTKEETPFEGGWEEPAGSKALVMSAYVGMAYQEPHVFAGQWQVPETLNTGQVQCTFEHQPLT